MEDHQPLHYNFNHKYNQIYPQNYQMIWED